MIHTIVTSRQLLTYSNQPFLDLVVILPSSYVQMIVSQNYNIFVIREQWTVPPSSYFTDLYWFIFHFLHQERERGESQVPPLSLQTPTTISYSLLWKGKVSLTASSGYHLRHFYFIYVDSLAIGKVFLISHNLHIFLKVKVFRILVVFFF